MVRMTWLHQAIVKSGWGDKAELISVMAQEGEVIALGKTLNNTTKEMLLAERPYTAHFEFTGVRGDIRDLLAVFSLWLQEHGKEGETEAGTEKIIQWAAIPKNTDLSNLVVEVRLMEEVIVQPSPEGPIEIGEKKWRRVEPSSPAKAQTLAVASG